MSNVPTPSGFDTSKSVKIAHPDCLVTIGFDRQRTYIPRFLVRLHYQVSDTPVAWEAIARFDHNEDPNQGHDIYSEGLHIDVKEPSGDWTKLHPAHGAIPRNRGVVIRACHEYFDREAQYFVDVYQGTTSPGSPSGWPDGGRPPNSFIPAESVRGDMPRESSDEPLSSEELSELLADATGTTAADIERGAEEFEIGPPDEAEVVDE